MMSSSHSPLLSSFPDNVVFRDKILDLGSLFESDESFCRDLGLSTVRSSYFLKEFFLSKEGSFLLELSTKTRKG